MPDGGTARSEFREVFKYGTWANVALVDHCLGLPAEAVEVVVEGTFGPIVETFAHMLEQERWGLWVLKRAVPDFNESSLESIRSTFLQHGELWQEVMYALQTAHHGLASRGERLDGCMGVLEDPAAKARMKSTLAQIKDGS